MNRTKSPYFCANGRLSDLDDGSSKHYLSSGSESSFDDADNRILVDAIIENEGDIAVLPCSSKTVHNLGRSPDSPLSYSSR